MKKLDQFIYQYQNQIFKLFKIDNSELIKIKKALNLIKQIKRNKKKNNNCGKWR